MAQISGSIALDTGKLAREIRELVRAELASSLSDPSIVDGLAEKVRTELGRQLAPSLAELHAKIQALTEVVDNMASELAARGLMEAPDDVVIRDATTTKEVMRVPVMAPAKIHQVERPSWDEGLDRAASQRADRRLAEENAGITDSWREDA